MPLVAAVGGLSGLGAEPQIARVGQKAATHVHTTADAEGLRPQPVPFNAQSNGLVFSAQCFYPPTTESFSGGGVSATYQRLRDEQSSRTSANQLHAFSSKVLGPSRHARPGAAGDPRMLSGGIAEALIATAAGLCVAIPALIAYRYLRGRVESFVVDMEKEAIKLADVVEDSGRERAGHERAGSDRISHEAPARPVAVTGTGAR